LRAATTTKDSERWAGNVIIDTAGKSEAEARRILRAWLDNGVLIEVEYTSPKQRKAKKRVEIVEAKAAEILGTLYRPAT
jgi:hypothetical protein